MPRRGVDILPFPEPPKKKTKVLDDAGSMDVSFCDDEALPPGIVIANVLQKKWRIGKPIGRGSFGRIYLASDEIDKEVTKQNARYVVKIEPHTNGPLFVEVHRLITLGNKVKQWRLQKKQKRLGMPIYIGSGSFTDENGTKYRFLVLPRYDIDLQKIIARGRTLDLRNVLVLAVQILDVLEFLHKHGYTHSDIKSSNLMLGFDGSRLSTSASIKPIQSFQKGTKEVAVLSGKQRRPKTTKSRTSNYYEDEDFIVNSKLSCDSFGDETCDKKLCSVKKKFRKILSDKSCRTLHRHHAFNLRQLSNYVNYEEFNSSVCSDQSYQKFLDDNEDRKHLFYYSNERFYSDNSKSAKTNIKTAMLPPMTDHGNDEMYKEAILSQSNGQIYLLDYGLASRFLDSEGKHVAYGMDARKAHDGTLEYSSRDSHIGAHSRRSDLETLGYNLLDWLTGTLPWKSTEMLAEPDLVHAIKKNFMNDIKYLLKTCFKTDNYPQFLESYLQYVTSLDFTKKPDYDYCRSIFRSEFIKNGFGTEKDMMLNFNEHTVSSSISTKRFYSKKFGRRDSPNAIARNGVKKSFGRENICSLENNLKLELLKQTLNSSSDGIRKPCTSRNFFISDADLVARLKKSLMPQELFGKKISPKTLRSHKRNIKKRKGKRGHRNSIGKFGNFMGSARQFTWAEILAGNPEDIIRKDRNTTVEDVSDEETCKYRIRKLSNSSDISICDNLQSPLLRKDYLQGKNPTYAMKEVIGIFRKKGSGKPSKEDEEYGDKFPGYTLPMIRICINREKRKAKDLQDLKEQSDRENGIQKEKNSELPLKCARSLRSKSANVRVAAKVTSKKATKVTPITANTNVALGKLKPTQSTTMKVSPSNNVTTAKSTKVVSTVTKVTQSPAKVAPSTPVKVSPSNNVTITKPSKVTQSPAKVAPSTPVKVTPSNSVNKIQSNAPKVTLRKTTRSRVARQMKSENNNKCPVVMVTPLSFKSPRTKTREKSKPVKKKDEASTNRNVAKTNMEDSCIKRPPPPKKRASELSHLISFNCRRHTRSSVRKKR